MKYDQEIKRYNDMYERLFESLQRRVPKSTVPEGRSGPWAVERFEITEEDVMMARMRSMVRRERGYTPPGTYTRLRHDKRGIVMSDTYDELKDLSELYYMAQGHVLITGLGLGCAVETCLRKKEVEHVTVIEIDEDIIKLTSPHFADPRVKIVHADAFTWKPEKDVGYTVAWHDIWWTICGDNKPEITKLKRRYGRKVALKQGVWGEHYIRRGIA